MFGCVETARRVEQSGGLVKGEGFPGSTVTCPASMSQAPGGSVARLTGSAGPGGVRLSIYDTSGRLVKTLVDSEQPVGLHIVMWRGVDSNGIAVSSGVYFCRLEWEGQSHTRKLVLVR